MGYPKSELAQRIFKAHSNREYVSVLVHGHRGVGKSTFAMWTIFDLYHNGYEMPADKSWDMAFRKTIHGPENIVKMGKNALKKGRPDPVWHADDAGKFLHGDNYNIRETRPWMIQYKSLSPTMRKATSGLIYSLDRLNDLVSFVRDRPHNLILIQKDKNRIEKTGNRFWRVAFGYEKDIWPSGKETISNDFQWRTKFNCKLPDEIFKQYDKIRDQYTLDALENLEKATQVDEKKDWDPYFVAKMKLEAEELGKKISYTELNNITEIPRSTLHKYMKKVKEDRGM